MGGRRRRWWWRGRRSGGGGTRGCSLGDGGGSRKGMYMYIGRVYGKKIQAGLGCMYRWQKRRNRGTLC